LTSIQTLTGPGPHADVPTAALPLVDFGFGNTTNGYNLVNKGAIIRRVGNGYAIPINNAALAGAAFVVFYNNTNVIIGRPLGDTEFVRIPAVFINNANGMALTNIFKTNATALAQIHLSTTNFVFNVTNTLLCEHVALRVKTDHSARGDLRITLVSPSGTRSVLQRFNQDTNAGPADWTYYSTQHFFESSAGNWTAYFSDEAGSRTGSVQSVSLDISGTQIFDTDKDGLDDIWEIIHFACLMEGPADDPDRDGYSNMREQLMATNPNAGVPLQLDLSFWAPGIIRLSWPGSPNYNYQLYGGTNVSALPLITNVPGKFPETEWFIDISTMPHQFYRVRGILNP
jgi:subtilisin-like proprotein convertase family protein